jgi:hypothetical protein
LAGGLFALSRAPESFQISAESEVARSQRSSLDGIKNALPATRVGASEPSEPSPQPSSERPSSDNPNSKATVPLSARPASKLPPPSLEQELAGLARVRAALDRGDAKAALSELHRFDQGQGFRKLTVEAKLLRIEALAQAGKTDESRAEARRFVETNPNNPLVDRAEKFARPPTAPAENFPEKPERK